MGSAYIYERVNATDWGDPIPITLPTLDSEGRDDTGLEIGSRFGFSVSIFRNYAIVGAIDDDNNIPGEVNVGEEVDAGSAYIYERVDGEWDDPIHLKLPMIDGSDGTGLERGSRFGSSVSIHVNRAIVGAVLDSNERGRQAGSAYIYERVGTGSWGTPIALTLPNIDGGGTDDTGLERDSRFGRSVAISGSYAIVGAPSDDNELDEDAGSAYTYNRASARDWDLLASTTRTATLAFAGCGATTTHKHGTVGTNICSGGALAASGHGDMISLDNTAASLNGSATFTCNRGTWEVDSTTATCAPEGVASVSDTAIPVGSDVVIDVAHTRPADVEITVTDDDGTEVEGVTFTPPSVTGTGTNIASNSNNTWYCSGGQL